MSTTEDKRLISNHNPKSGYQYAFTLTKNGVNGGSPEWDVYFDGENRYYLVSLYGNGGAGFIRRLSGRAGLRLELWEYIKPRLIKLQDISISPQASAGKT